jgi:hypothetical protein
MGEGCSTNVEKRKAYRILVGKPEGIKSLGRLDVGGMIIKKWICEIDRMGWYGLD